MTFHEQLEGGVTVLHLNGTLMGGQVNACRDRIQDLLKDNVTQIVLDLEQVEWMNSSAFGILASGLKMVRAAGGDVRLAGANERVARLFQQMYLDRIFILYDTVEEAAASFVEAVGEDQAGAAQAVDEGA